MSSATRASRCREGTPAYSRPASRSCPRRRCRVGSARVARNVRIGSALPTRARGVRGVQQKRARVARRRLGGDEHADARPRLFPPTRRDSGAAPSDPRDRVQVARRGPRTPGCVPWPRLGTAQARARPSLSPLRLRQYRVECAGGTTAHRGERVFRDDVRHGTPTGRGNRAPDATEREQQQAVRVFHRGRLSRRPQRPMDCRHAQSPSRVTERGRSSTS